MHRSRLLFVLCAVSAAIPALADDPPAEATPPPSIAELHAACDADIQKLCPGVQPGGGRILACLKQHKESVSDLCTLTVVRAVQASSPGST